MAETIKGISVLIEGDTTGLSKALADVNKSSRDIQSELKQVEKLLKLDPTNTELLAQKQTLLTNAIANTKEKLDSLKKAQEQVNEQFAKGEINEGQYRAFQREIAATEQELRRYEAQISKADEATDKLGDSTEGTGDKFQTASEKMKGAGEVMSVGITAPITAAGGLMLKGAIDAQMAQGKLQASLGVTAEKAEELGGVAKEVWLDGFGENIGEVSANIAIVRKNMGDLADDELKSVAKGAMTIADVFEQDVNEVVVSAGVAAKNFGIDGKDALDILTVGFQQGGDFSGELLDSFKEYSPQFAAMGLEADKAMGILIAGAKAGAFNMDIVGDAAKEFNLRATDQSKSTAEAFAAIGLSAEQIGPAIAKGGEEAQGALMATLTAIAAMKDPLAQNAAGTALFGTQWEDVRSKVIIAMADGVKGIGDFKGATDAASKAINDSDPGSAFVSAMRELQAAIGPSLLPLAGIIKNTLVPAIKSLVDWFTNLSPTGQKTVLAIAGIAAAIGPLLVILGLIISGIGGLVGGLGAISLAIEGGATGIGILTTAFPALATAITVITGPVGIAIAVIAALAAGAYLIISNWTSIKGFFSNLWAGITSTMVAAWEGIKQVFAGMPGAIGGFFANILNNIIAWGSALISWVATEIPLIIGGIINFFGELPGKLGYILGYAIGTLIKWGIGAVAWVVAEVPKVVIGIVTFFSELPGELATIFNNVMTGIGTWGTNVISWITTEVPKFIIGIVNYFSELPGKIIAFLSQVLTNLGSWISNMASSVATEIPKIITSITDFFGSLPGKMLDIGGNIVKGLWNGITGMAGWLWGKIKDFAKGIIDGLKDGLQIHSPSKLTMGIGENLGMGLAIGMHNTVSEVTRQSQSMAQAAIPKGASGSYDGARGGSGTSTSRNISNSFAGMFDGANFYVRTEDDIKKTAQELFRLQQRVLRSAGGKA